MIDPQILYLVMAFALTWLTDVMLMEVKVSHYGPFPSVKATVVWIDSGVRHEYPVTLLDRVRRLYGLFTIEQEEDRVVWIVKQARIEMWTCPKCLSIWLTPPFAVLWYVLVGEPVSALLLMPSLAGFATVVLWLKGYFLNVSD